MRLNGKTLFKYRDLALKEAREMRQQALGDSGSEMSDIDFETEWVTEFVHVENSLAKRFLEKWGYDGDSAEASRPRSGAFLESFDRQKIKKEKKALGAAVSALENLRSALSDTSFIQSNFTGAGFSPKRRFVEALNLVRDEISLRKYLIDRLEFSKKYRTNQTEIVLAVSPVLLEAGYPKRASAKIIAFALSNTDTELKMTESLVNTLAVAIGNIEKEQRELNSKKRLPFLYP